MSKRKKIIIWIVSVLGGLILLSYFVLCAFSGRPGINGFEVTHYTIKLLVSGDDYVKVKENCYIYRVGALDDIILNDYDGYRFRNGESPEDTDDISEINYISLAKSVIVEKDGKEYYTGIPAVWFDFVDGIHSAYFRPIE